MKNLKNHKNLIIQKKLRNQIMMLNQKLKNKSNQKVLNILRVLNIKKKRREKKKENITILQIRQKKELIKL